MKAKLIEYNDSGDRLKEESLEIRFASSEKCPVIEIILSDKQFRHRAIYLPAKDVLNLIFGRILERIRDISFL